VIDILGGVAVISVGLILGDSIFISENPTLMGYAFDGLGVFFIGKGVYKLIQNSRSESTDNQSDKLDGQEDKDDLPPLPPA